MKTKTTISKQIYKEYVENHINSLELSKRYNLTPSTILKHVRKHGGIIRSPRTTALKYTCNESIFNIIDSHEKAYWIGFIVADGSIYDQRKVLKISLSNKDKEILLKFKKFINSNHPIHTYKSDTSFTQNGNFSEISISSPILVNDLNALGIHSNKTFTVRTPNILPIFLPSFYRGLLDGDGWISVAYRKSNTYDFLSIESGICGNFNIIEDFSTFLKSHNIKNKITKDKSIFRVRLSTNATQLFLKIIYSDQSVLLDRKFNKYMEFMNSRKT